MSNKRSHHRRSNEHVLLWLDDNYELKEGVCLPRCLLYHHYLDYMMKKNDKPIGAAAFGKLVRQRFPKITTRRLGTRGQSKYHYYGVGIKKNSIYYKDEKPNGTFASGKNFNHKNRISKSNLKLRKFRTRISRSNKLIPLSYFNFGSTTGSSPASSMTQSVTSNASVNHGIQLKNFPRSNDFIVPIDIQRDKLSTFLLMYQTHCQRIIDTILCVNCDDVERYLNHFWNGIPSHLMELMSSPFMVNVIECADSILYTAIEDALTPKSLHDLPEHFITEIKRILNLIPQWIQFSMKDLPYDLVRKKIEIHQEFSSALKRQISFMELAKSCKLAFSHQENVNQMSKEIEAIDTYEIWSQMSTFRPQSNQIELIYKTFHDLISKMKKTGLNMERLTDWVNNIVYKCIVNGKYACLTSRASELVFALSTYFAGVIRDLTLNNAKSFGYWHLLFITLEEYVLLMVSKSVRRESQSVRRLTIMKQPLITETFEYAQQQDVEYKQEERKRFKLESEDNAVVNYIPFDDYTFSCYDQQFDWQTFDHHNNNYAFPSSSNRIINSSDGTTYTCLP